MRKQFIFLMISALSGIVASCSQDSENELLLDNREVIFNIGVAQTRTLTEGKVTTFVPNDQIGIFGIKRGATKVFNQNVPYTYTTEKEWTAKPAITFPIEGDEVDFYAYYPYGSHESTIFDFTVESNQEIDRVDPDDPDADEPDIHRYDRSDLLMAKNTVAQLTDKTIRLQFVHAMAMVEVRPVFSVDSSIELNEVKLMAVRTAKVDLLSQTAVVKADVKAEAIILQKVSEGVYRGVVPVQTLKGRILEFGGIDKATNLTVFYQYSLSSDKKLVSNAVTSFTVNL